MPIAAAGQPTTQEPCVYSRLPATPDPIPKRGHLRADTGVQPQEHIDYAGVEGGRGPGGHSSRVFPEPGSSSQSQSPPTPSPFATSYPQHHPHSPAMEPPRTRSRSRSGFYQYNMSSGANGNNAVNASAGFGVPHPQQHNSGCMPRGGPSPSEIQRTPGSNLPPSAQRHAGPGAHRNAGAGKRFSYYFYGTA